MMVSDMVWWMYLVLFAAGLWAGTQNALAGGGSFITLPALIASGMSPLAANVTSTVALFPAQVTSGVTGRNLVAGTASLSFKALFVISLVGGIVGAYLLLHTPSGIFSHMVPWLVLFATAVLTWGSFFRKPVTEDSKPLGTMIAGIVQFCIAVYGGYFGGGIGFVMLAALTAAHVPLRNAGATKNVLAAVMNASAVALFVFSDQLHWLQCVCLGSGAILGGWLGARALHKVNERKLRIGVIALGVLLTIGLFVRPV